MWENQPVRVLRGLRLNLKIVCMNIRNDIIICGMKIPRIILVLLFANGVITMYILSIRFCIEHNFDLNAIAAPMSVFWGCLQITLMYLTFSRENSLMVQTLDDLNNFVTESKYSMELLKKISEF